MMTRGGSISLSYPASKNAKTSPPGGGSIHRNQWQLWNGMGGSIPLESVAALLRNTQPKFKNASKSTYMFLSLRDGLPLSVATPNESLKTLVKKHPQFEKILSPHILRNTFHDFLDEKLESTLENQGPIAKQAIKSSLQEYAGGWSSGSSMVNRYPKGSIQRRVGELRILINLNTDSGRT
jgi:hypothetical protein